MRLKAPRWKPGDRIPRGRDALEVVEVRYGTAAEPGLRLTPT
jgi:hypothetical protein